MSVLIVGRTNDAAIMRRLLDRGIERIYTDRPLLLLSLMSK
jgi:hypothetical protein